MTESASFAVPEHPLPEEIQKMNRNETVCKFCGISYLIHNEVKALQEKLAEAQKQMEYYRGSMEREQVLKSKLKAMNGEFVEQSQKLKDQEQQLELFKSDLKMKASLIDDMYLQKRQYESSIQEEHSKSQKLSAIVSCLSSSLKQYNLFIKQHKKSFGSLKEDVLQQKNLSKEILLYFGKQVIKITARFKEKVTEERHDAEMKAKKMGEQLHNFQVEVNQLRQADSELPEMRRKYVELQNKLHVYEKHVSQLEEGNVTLRERNITVENDLIQKSKDESEMKNGLEALRREKQEEHCKYEGLLRKKDEELKKLDVLCKSLEKLMNEKSAAEREVREKVVDKDAQLKNLEEMVNQMRVESWKYKIEREQTIVSHHNRIEQLRESYAKKLEASEMTCRTLQNELNEMKMKFASDVEGSQRLLKDGLEKEIKNLNTKHSEEVDLLESKIGNLQEKLEEDARTLRDFKEEINQLKNRLSTNKAHNAQEVQKYHNEILNLKKNLEVLQYKTENKCENNVDKSKYEAAQKNLQDTKTQLKVLEQVLQEKTSEMSILQDTVRRECEERLELTQALSDARMKILSLQQTAPQASRVVPTYKRLNRQTENTSDIRMSSETSEIIASRVRKIKSTGSERPKRESVDNFRDRIAAALGRESRVNHTR